MRGAIAGGLVCGLALLGFGGQAQGADTIGSDLSNPANVSFSCWDPASCTVLDLSTDNVGIAPYDGGIVRWRVKSDGAGNSPVALQVVSWPPEGLISAVAASQPEEVADGVNTFPTRLPIAGGDLIAIECCKEPGERIFSSGLLGQAFGMQQGSALVPGAPPVQASVILMNGEVLVNADIEADEDGDGYGDETQDACPSDASTQGECPPPPPPPQTRITRSPKKIVKMKGRRVDVKFAFTSSEANSNFFCSMDASPWKACASPFRTKVRAGKHRFYVLAEKAGSTDDSPAVSTFRVKRRRG